MENKKRGTPEGSVPKWLIRLLAAVFVLVLTVTCILLFALPKKEMSETENRVLAKPPVLSISSLSDGSFMKDVEKYLSDHFPFRDKVIELKTALDRTMGKKEENGVYIGKDGFLFQKQTAFDTEKVSAMTKAMNGFVKKLGGVKAAAIISPNSSDILTELMPVGCEIEDRIGHFEAIGQGLEKIDFINCYSLFYGSKDRTSLFYRTDHHWTTRAAYLAFEQVAKSLNKSTKGIDYSFYTVANDFQGTLSSSSAVTGSSDKIEICTPDEKHSNYVVNYESSSRKTVSLFEREKLEGKNKYEVFLGGNYDKVVITTDSDTDDTLLLFKDSYANCMIPMLTPLFSKIVVIDPRYYSDSLSKSLEEYSITHVLFLYNMDTFLADTSLCDVLQS